MDKIHLKAPNGTWINDPNGFIYFGGEYHLFYQTFPYAPVWGRMHWGHAVSPDLVSWEHKGIALYPSVTDDRSGCFSGSAVEHNGKLYLYYTGVNYYRENPENINHCVDDGFTAAQLMLTSEDGKTFDNLHGKRTIIPSIKDNEIGDETHTRDPKVWQGKNGNWYLIMGTSVKGKGRLLFYRSTDLENWEYVNCCERENLGWMWECPDYFEVNGKGLVIFSPMGFLQDGKEYDSAAICFIAEFDKKSCTMNLADEYTFLDYGLDLYAPQSTLDEQGRRVITAWLRMPKLMENGGIGMMCIPRVVEIKNGHVYFQPHPNVRNAFSKEINTPNSKDGYLLKTVLQNGESLNIGGYVIRREHDKIITDRSAVFPKNTNVRCAFETPVIKDGNDLEIYVEENLIEVYINGGEYVVSNAVYGLTDEISGAEYRLYAAE